MRSCEKFSESHVFPNAEEFLEVFEVYSHFLLYGQSIKQVYRLHTLGKLRKQQKMNFTYIYGNKYQSTFTCFLFIYLFILIRFVEDILFR